MSRPARLNPEWAFQKHLKNFVREAVAAPHEFFAFDRSKPAGQWTHAREKARGIRKGTPDILLCVEGITPIWCELKAPGKKPDDDQRRMGQQLLAIGHHWFWCASVEAYRAGLETIGVPMHANARFLAVHHDAAVESDIVQARLKAGTIPKSYRRYTPKPTAAKLRKARSIGVLV